MKKIFKIFSIIALTFSILICSFACTEPEEKNIDFVSDLKLDMNSETLKQEVTVKNYVDGDTTHFYVPKTVSETGVLKARYLAINTPESTGKIEEWGKKASNFTKETLKNATSILIESDDTNWNLDSTGGRYLVWIWYKTSTESDYRNLNVEILQNGLAIASNSSANRYGDICVKAIAQASEQKLYVHSKDKDPDFPYGEAKPITLKELRCNVAEYNGIKVAFEGVITKSNDNTIYVEDYDEETGLYYGMTVYLGYGLSGDGLEIVSVGNRAKIVGSVQYYETGDSYQVSGLTYRGMKPNDPDNIQLLEKDCSPAYVEIDPQQFKTGKVEVIINEEKKQFSYADLILYTSVSASHLKVKRVYTTSAEDSASKGAMTLTCELNGIEIDIRTIVLYDDDHKLITASMYEGKTISVKGIVDCYQGSYQIKVFSYKDIIIE